MSKQPERRRIIFIDQAMQRRMIVAFMWPTTLCFAVTALVLVVLAVRMHESAAEAGVMLENFGAGVAAVLVFLTSASAFGLFHAIRLSHRVAGPAYRLRETLRMVREGGLDKRAVLRDGDYLGETADALNDFLDWLERHPPSADVGNDERTPQSNDERTPQSVVAATDEAQVPTAPASAPTGADA